MRILIHCNGGPLVGVGHVMRSLALSEEAVASGHEVTLFGEFAGDFLLRQLRDSGVEVLQQGVDGTSSLTAAVEQVEPDVLHLDTYDEVELTDHAFDAVAVVSNLADAQFGRRPADIVVDPNLGAELDPAFMQATRARLLGSRYVPLRSSIRARRGKWQLREEARRVLVVMGGADPRNLTPRVLDLLALTGSPLHVTAISVRPVAEPTRTSVGMTVDVVPPVDDLAGLVVQNDLVVSAAGSSVWELCCLGSPMALVCAAENQRAGYERVVAAGAALGLGSELSGEEAISAAKNLVPILDNPATRESFARQAGRIVDGLGAWRIVRTWEQLALPPLAMRRASLADADALLLWRNDPGTRCTSREQAEVSREQHERWLASSLVREDRLLLVASDDRGDLGTVRWDRVGAGEWEVSITLAPERRGQGLAPLVLGEGERRLLLACSSVRALTAVVHQENASSRRLFQRAGYLPDLPPDGAGFLALRKLVF